MGQEETKFYDPSEAMLAEEREKYKNQALRELIHYAYQNAPAVRDKMDNAGVNPVQINTVKDLEKIPITRKDDFTELQKLNLPFGGFLAVPLESLEKIFISPGPIYEPQDSEEEINRGAKAYHAAGFRKGDRVLVTWAHDMVPPGPRTADILNRLGATAIPTGVGRTELQVQIMKDLRVTGYAGTPSFLMTLIKKAEEMGYKFRDDFALKRAWVSAEPFPLSLRRSLEQDYGISAVQGYGTAEIGLLAFECEQKSGLHIPEEMIIEIVDPKTGKQLGPGEVGEVVATPFGRIFPLIRFGTGDLSSYTDELCPCGRTSSRLTGILGRIGIEVKVRGMFLHPKQVEEVMAKFGQISEFQALIERRAQRDELILNLELKNEAIDKQRLTNDLAKVFQDICRLKADEIQFVPRGTIPKKHKPILDKRTGNKNGVE